MHPFHALCLEGLGYTKQLTSGVREIPSRIYQPTTAIYGTTQLRRTSPRTPHSMGGTMVIDLV